MSALKGLEDGLREMADSQELEEARKGFSVASEAVLLAIKRFGVAPGQILYEYKCPMAFGGRGARWVEATNDPTNPYFGAAMPKCAELLETLSGK